MMFMLKTSEIITEIFENKMLFNITKHELKNKTTQGKHRHYNLSHFS